MEESNMGGGEESGSPLRYTDDEFEESQRGEPPGFVLSLADIHSTKHIEFRKFRAVSDRQFDKLSNSTLESYKGTILSRMPQNLSKIWSVLGPKNSSETSDFRGKSHFLTIRAISITCSPLVPKVQKTRGEQVKKSSR